MTDIAGRLEELRDRGLYRRLRLISGPQGPSVLLDGRPVPGKITGTLRPGQRLRIETPGGGGFGHER